MADLFSNVTSSNIIPLLMFFIGGVIAVVAILAMQWRRVRVAEIEANLKQQMLERGVSAADIERIVRATGSSANEQEDAPPAAGGPGTDKAGLARLMAENGYEGAEIAQVLKAFEAGEAGGKREPAQAT